MKISTSQLSTLRTGLPHRTVLKASIYQPTVVMKCRINNISIAQNARIIAFDTVSVGTYTDVKAGQTLLVGTTDGARDVGRIRIVSVTSTQFVVSENSNISWADNLYLTVIKLWELWPIFPRIIQNPSDPEDVIFYKDYDIDYAGQNYDLGTFPNAGPHRAGELENGSKSFYYSATGSFNPLGTSLTYKWEFEDGTPSTSSSLTPGLVSYDTPGHYVTSLAITGTNICDTTYRYVSIYPENTPIAGVEISEISISRGEGGATFTLKMHNPLFDIYDGAVVVIYKDDWFGAVRGGISGNAPNTSDIFLVGYILKDTIRWNYADGVVEFQVGSITQVMKKSVGFSVSVESKSVPSTWFELRDIDVRRAIYHYLKWHTTVLSIADFQFLGTDYPIQFFDSDRESMFDAIDNLMRGTLIGQISADMQGKIWAQIDPYAVPNGYAVFPTNPIIKQDWMGQPYLDETPDDPISYLELGGIAYSGSTGTSAALMSCAPGDSPGFRGALDRRQGLALGNQAQLNTLSGVLYANLNTRYKNLDLNMAGNYSYIDIAPVNLYYTVISPEDTTKGIDLTAYYAPENISWNYSPESQFLFPSITFRKVEVTTIDGQTIPIPEIPPDEGGGGGGGTHLPPFPIFPPVTQTPTIMKLVGTNQVPTGQTEIMLYDGMPFASLDVYNSISGTSATSTLMWPSILHPTDANGYIDILVGGIYRINSVISAGPAFLPTSMETVTFFWSISPTNPSSGDYPGGSTVPYRQPLKVGTTDLGRRTFTMQDIFYLYAGTTLGTILNNNLGSGSCPYWIATTIELLLR